MQEGEEYNFTRYVTITVAKHRLQAACERRRPTVRRYIRPWYAAQILGRTSNCFPRYASVYSVSFGDRRKIPKPTKPGCAGVRILRPPLLVLRAPALCIYVPSHAGARQASWRGRRKKAPRDPSCEHEPKFPHHREGGLCSCLPPALGTAPYVGRLLGAPYHYSVHDGRSVFPGGRRASGCRGGRCDAGVFCLLGLVISVRSQQRGQPCQCRHR